MVRLLFAFFPKPQNKDFSVTEDQYHELVSQGSEELCSFKWTGPEERILVLCTLQCDLHHRGNGGRQFSWTDFQRRDRIRTLLSFVYTSCLNSRNCSIGQATSRYR